METITKKNAMRALREHGNNSYSELKDFVKILGNMTLAMCLGFSGIICLGFWLASDFI